VLVGAVRRRRDEMDSVAARSAGDVDAG
jgi:hypothetical protein